MLNSRVKWVMVLLVLFFISLSCSKKEEEPNTETPRQETPAEQKSAMTGQGQGGDTVGADGTVPAADTATAEADKAGESGGAATEAQGEDIYQRTCSSCHATGMAGAPKTGDVETWSSLIAKGEEQLVQNAIDGIGTMPPKGGNATLSDEEVRSAVLYMLEQSR